MGNLASQKFVCVDCETTGLDPKVDPIIEVGVAVFDSTRIYDEYTTLVDPGVSIPQESIEIHNITDSMVKGAPKIKEVIPKVLELIGNHTIIGHGIAFDIELLATAAEKDDIHCTIFKNQTIDTLRLARHYGNSPTNSLEQLCYHFNIPVEGAHRALNDVIMNIEVFKNLTRKYKTTDQLMKILSKPILLKEMPLGKHKGRPMSEVPLKYLHWMANKDFDQDLLFTIRTEINRRKKGNLFVQAGNPFFDL